MMLVRHWRRSWNAGFEIPSARYDDVGRRAYADSVRRLAIATLALTLVAATLAADAARADGDPASDVLYSANLFLPYSAPVPAPLARRLRGALQAAQASGRPLLVALIAGPLDLGAVSSLYGKPERYARF